MSSCCLRSTSCKVSQMGANSPGVPPSVTQRHNPTTLKCCHGRVATCTFNTPLHCYSDFLNQGICHIVDYFILTVEGPSIRPSIFNLNLFLSSGWQGSAGPSPGCHRAKAGWQPWMCRHTETKNHVHQHTHLQSHRQVRLSKSPHMHVFSMWE